MGILFLLGCCWWSMFFELIVPLCIPAPFNLRWGGVLPPIPFFRAHLCCIPIQAILSCIVRSVSFPFFLEKLQKSNIHTSSSKLNNSSLQDQACYVLWHIGTFFGEIFSEVTFSSFYLLQPHFQWFVQSIYKDLLLRSMEFDFLIKIFCVCENGGA